MSTDAAWSIDPAELARKLGSDLSRGLTAAEAQRRFERWGPNRLREAPPRSRWAIFVSQFAEWMVGLLAVAAAISAAVGDWQDTVLIGLIVLANAVIGYIQEQRAEAAVVALKKLTQPTARAWRDGALTEIAAEELVPGDVVELTSGNIVPADCRLASAVALQANESPLTGESLPVDKSPESVPRETPLPDRMCMVHSGTVLTSGRGRGLVVATGMNTQIGRIATLLEATRGELTPLQRRLSALSKQLAVLVLIVCVAMFVVSLSRASGESWQELLLTAVSLAVAAVPEGLPAVITIALALGSQRMARQRAIVRQLMAVETLGSVDVICTDKTGTLTQSKMTMADLVLLSDSAEARRQFWEAATLCNEAQAAVHGAALGGATDVAILNAAVEANIDVAAVRKAWPRAAEIPFDSRRKRMTTLHRGPGGEQALFVKGAAEAVLDRATRRPSGESLTDADRRDLLDQVAELARRGRRVLAVARRNLADVGNPDHSASATTAQLAAWERELTLLGFVGLVDPIRPEVPPAVAECRSAGIRVVMITGDHQDTARAIAQESGLAGEADETLSGAQLDMLSDEELRQRAPRVAVYARVAPEHKLRIVRAHQALGSVVAMTGDGVNDAPALKQADIGVAMGITGADVSKQAAKMVLADDNFATIVAAVREGRVVYDNIRRFVQYLLTSNIGEIMVLLAAILLGWPLPLLPVHLLWINLVTDGLPALALGFEIAEPNVMRRQPRSRDESIFAEGLWLRIAAVGTLIAATCLWLFQLHLPADGMARDAAALAYPRTMVFWTLAMFQLFYVLALRSNVQSFFKMSLGSNHRLVAAVLAGTALQAAVVYVPPLQSWFHTVPLALPDLLLATALATLAFLAAEVRKALRSR